MKTFPGKDGWVCVYPIVNIVAMWTKFKRVRKKWDGLDIKKHLTRNLEMICWWKSNPISYEYKFLFSNLHATGLYRIYRVHVSEGIPHMNLIMYKTEAMMN